MNITITIGNLTYSRTLGWRDCLVLAAVLARCAY